VEIFLNKRCYKIIESFVCQFVAENGNIQKLMFVCQSVYENSNLQHYRKKFTEKDNHSLQKKITLKTLQNVKSLNLFANEF
jgi:hypothetical protein